MNTVAPELLDDLRALGFEAAESADPLRGGRGGRTWRIRASHGTYVLHRRALERPSGHSVLREQRSTALAHAAGVGPQPVAVDDERGLLLTRWIPGRAATSTSVGEPETLARVAVALRLLHAAPLPRHAVRPIQQRLRYLHALERIGDRGPIHDVVASTAESLSELGRLLGATSTHAVLVHGDVVPGNVILSRRSTALVDFEYAGRGDPAFDLGNLAASADLPPEAIAALVRSYAAGDGANGRRAWELRARAWMRWSQGAWIAWVALGTELGPQSAAWNRWARSAAVSLDAANRAGELTSLIRRLSG